MKAEGLTEETIVLMDEMEVLLNAVEGRMRKAG